MLYSSQFCVKYEVVDGLVSYLSDGYSRCMGLFLEKMKEQGRVGYFRSTGEFLFKKYVPFIPFEEFITDECKSSISKAITEQNIAFIIFEIDHKKNIRVNGFETCPKLEPLPQYGFTDVWRPKFDQFGTPKKVINTLANTLLVQDVHEV